MNIIFEKVKLHHFLSFGEAEVDLRDKGFCMIKGVNRNPKDAAKSNGAGKSTCFNAILFALTGETAQGLKSNLGNLYYNDGCWVELEFKVDGVNYRLIRYKDDVKHGTNLKIWVNGEEKSGKGIRESQAVLDTLLPDFTSELLGSAIILGQGLPQRFTSNTPAKRKEILEHLTKSDFMIEDIKNKINVRSNALNDELRKVEDNILSVSTTQSVLNKQLETAKKELEELSIPIDFEIKIREREELISKLTDEINKFQKLIDNDTRFITENNQIILEASSRMNTNLETIRVQHEEEIKKYNERKLKLNSQISTLTSTIKQLENIKDICPTCGQKIPGAQKPDTTKQNEELATLQVEWNNLLEEIHIDENEYKATIQDIKDIYNNETEEAQTRNQGFKKDLESYNNIKQSKSSDLVIEQNNLANLKAAQKSHQDNLASITLKIQDLENQLHRIEYTLTELTSKQDKVKLHIEVVNKITTLVRKDFRGFLVKNSIDFINLKAKEYSCKIFNTAEMDFVLDGNDINIQFCGKDYENLSGGEKQRVDLIINFAIRDLLCTYLNFSSNILVLDEITDALDAVSCDKVVKFITNELYNIESVFVISHHSDELMLPAESEIVIEKDIYGVSSIK